MFDNQPLNSIPLMLPEAPIFLDRNRFKPKFCQHPFALDMNVTRFGFIRAKEHKVVRTILENDWHDG